MGQRPLHTRERVVTDSCIDEQGLYVPSDETVDRYASGAYGIATTFAREVKAYRDANKAQRELYDWLTDLCDRPEDPERIEKLRRFLASPSILELREPS
jgi:hypothetical protein